MIILWLLLLFNFYRHYEFYYISFTTESIKKTKIDNTCAPMKAPGAPPTLRITALEALKGRQILRRSKIVCRKLGLHFSHKSTYVLMYTFYQELLKEKSNPRLKGIRKGIIVKDKEFCIPILNTFPTR